MLTFLRPRLTRAARDELRVLADYLAPIPFQNKPDTHMLAASKKQYTSSGVYQALLGSYPPTDASRIWATKLPTKIKFFAWLLFHGRLNTRAHLYRRNIKTLHESWCGRCHGVLETDEHIFKECSTSVGVRDCLHIFIQNDSFKLLGKLIWPTFSQGLFLSTCFSCFFGTSGKPEMHWCSITKISP